MPLTPVVGRLADVSRGTMIDDALAAPVAKMSSIEPEFGFEVPIPTFPMLSMKTRPVPFEVSASLFAP